MASSTASAVSHYATTILTAYKRGVNRRKLKRQAVEAEILAIEATPKPVTQKTAVRRIKKAAPSLDPAIINMAVKDIARSNDEVKVMIDDVKQKILRMQQDMDDEEALMALL